MTRTTRTKSTPAPSTKRPSRRPKTTTAAPVEQASTTKTPPPSSRSIAIEILTEHGSPMRVAELAELVVKSGRITFAGATPLATVGAQIYLATKNDGPLVKTGRGEVALRPAESAPLAALRKSTAKAIAAGAEPIVEQTVEAKS